MVSIGCVLYSIDLPLSDLMQQQSMIKEKVVLGLYIGIL